MFLFFLICRVLTRHFNSNRYSCFVIAIITPESSYDSISEAIIHWEPKFVIIIYNTTYSLGGCMSFLEGFLVSI